MIFFNKNKKQSEADLNLLFYVGVGIIVAAVFILAIF